jgi:hypothetical protein
VDITLPLGQLVRLEWHLVGHASAGVFEAKLFAAHSTTPLGTASFSSINTRGNAARYRTGISGTGPITVTYWDDAVAWASGDWIGPADVAPSPPTDIYSDAY